MPCILSYPGTRVPWYYTIPGYSSTMVLYHGTGTRVLWTVMWQLLIDRNSTTRVFIEFSLARNPTTRVLYPVGYCRGAGSCQRTRGTLVNTPCLRLCRLAACTWRCFHAHFTGEPCHSSNPVDSSSLQPFIQASAITI